jgi:hypothetical protein
MASLEGNKPHRRRIQLRIVSARVDDVDAEDDDEKVVVEVGDVP